MDGDVARVRVDRVAEDRPRGVPEYAEDRAVGVRRGARVVQEESRERRLAHAARARDEEVLGPVATGGGLEGARDLCHFRLPVDETAWEARLAKDVRLNNHLTDG